jgi:hypothetical protein
MRYLNVRLEALRFVNAAQLICRVRKTLSYRQSTKIAFALTVYLNSNISIRRLKKNNFKITLGCIY